MDQRVKKILDITMFVAFWTKETEYQKKKSWKYALKFTRNEDKRSLRGISLPKLNQGKATPDVATFSCTVLLNKPMSTARQMYLKPT